MTVPPSAGRRQEQPQRTAQPRQRDGDAAERKERHEAQEHRVAEGKRVIAGAQALDQQRHAAACRARTPSGWRGTGSVAPSVVPIADRIVPSITPNSMPPAKISTMTPGMPVEMPSMTMTTCVRRGEQRVVADQRAQALLLGADPRRLEAIERARKEQRRRRCATRTSSGRNARRRFIGKRGLG